MAPLIVHVNGLATYAIQNIYSHMINCVCGARVYTLSYGYSSVLSPEVDESTIQLPTLLQVVGAMSLPLKCEYPLPLH